MSIELLQHPPLAPARIVVYGPPGVGKTTFAAGAPSPVFLPFEDGLHLIKAPRITSKGRRTITTMLDFESALHGLLVQEHTFETVIIDSATSMQTVLGEHAAKELGHSTFEAVPYGVGYSEVVKLVSSVLRSLDELREKRAMSIILLAHATIGIDGDPEGGGFPRTELRLQHGKNSSVRGTVREWADGVYYADFVRTVTKDGKGKSEKLRVVDGRGERVLRTKPHAARDGKDRCGLPATLPLDYNAFLKAYAAAVSGYLPPDASSVDEDPEPETETTSTETKP